MRHDLERTTEEKEKSLFKDLECKATSQPCLVSLSIVRLGTSFSILCFMLGINSCSFFSED